ncbi:hypothetical protein BJ165DRAFT_1510499 [Panaeolus papilionaceus]|nr:hypothetical protein BJ165DRAFT_1510499 [Panaeolus papilionaceus]
MLQRPTPSHIMDPYTRLDRYAQKSKQDIHIATEKTSGPAHDPIWVATLNIAGIAYEGVGSTKMEAKNDAARLALQDL